MSGASVPGPRPAGADEFGRRRAGAEGVHRRYVCADCGLKWFVAAGRPRGDQATHCASCGGDLVGLLDPGDGRLPGRPPAILPPAAQDDCR